MIIFLILSSILCLISSIDYINSIIKIRKQIQELNNKVKNIYYIINKIKGSEE